MQKGKNGALDGKSSMNPMYPPGPPATACGSAPSLVCGHAAVIGDELSRQFTESDSRHAHITTHQGHSSSSSASAQKLHLAKMIGDHDHGVVGVNRCQLLSQDDYEYSKLSMF